MSLESPLKIREFQRKLYAKAKQEPSYRFYLLYDSRLRSVRWGFTDADGPALTCVGLV